MCILIGSVIGFLCEANGKPLESYIYTRRMHKTLMYIDFLARIGCPIVAGLTNTFEFIYLLLKYVEQDKQSNAILNKSFEGAKELAKKNGKN